MKESYTTGISLRAASVLVSMIVMALFLTSCEENISPIDLSKQDTYFSLYGYLFTGADSSFIRVVPFRSELTRPSPGPVYARVYSVHAATGRTVTWQDSLVEHGDKTFGHIFWTNEVEVMPESNYIIEVARSDGKVTQAVVKVPPRPHNVQIGAAIGLQQRIEWITDGPRMFEVDVSYVVESIYPSSGILTVTIPYVDSVRGSAQGWTFWIDLYADRQAVQEKVASVIDVRSDTRVILHELQLYLIVPSKEWDPPGGYNPFVLSQPGRFSNVENGYGFVGGAADTTIHWQLDSLTASNLNYLLP